MVRPSGVKKMIDAAKRKRKDDGVFELSWENSGVVVSANLKIVPNKAPAPAAPAQGGTGFRRLKLPETIVGGPAPAADAAQAAAPAGPAAVNTAPAMPATVGGASAAAGAATGATR